MPITKRLVVRNAKGVSNAKNYIDDEEKTMYNDENNFSDNINRETGYISNGIKTKNLVTGIKCSTTFADKEFLENATKYGNENDKRQAYHLIQSFSYDDPVTPTQVHEMGIELAKTLYPDYQCLVATHMDKGHLHNHILINATSLSGKKLRDDFYGSEGLMIIREVSDRIAKDNHCKVIDDAPPIGKYKGIQAYMQSVNKSWTTIIKDKIDTLKPLCSSLTELLELLSNEGYVVKQGKHIGVKPFGMDRYRRLDTLGIGYTQKELNYYFSFKQQHYIKEEELAIVNVNEANEVGKDYYNAMLKIKEGIIYSQKSLKIENSYPKYKYARNKDLQKLESLKEDITLLNKYNINSYSELSNSISEIKDKLKNQQQIYSDLKFNNLELLKKQTLVITYLKYYNQYMMYNDSKKFEKEEMPEEVKLFLECKNQLGNLEIDDVRNILLNIKESNLKTNQEFAKLSYLKYEYKKMNQLKIDAMEKNENFIKSVSISKKMIIEDKSNESYYYIRIPYSNKYTYILKDSVCWYGDDRAQLYLVDDDNYDIYDEEGKKIKTISAGELEEESKKEKQKISDNIKNKSSFEK